MQLADQPDHVVRKRFDGRHRFGLDRLSRDAGPGPDAARQHAITSNGSTYAAEILSGSTLEFACCAGQVVNYNFSGVISGTGPTGTLSDPSGVFANNVGSMSIGSTILAKAYFKTSIGQINFDSNLDAQSNSVSVTRVDAHTWIVDTSAGDVGFLAQTTTMPDPNNPHKTITVTSKTYYHLAFRLTGVTQ